MKEYIDSRTQVWAIACVTVGMILYIALDLIENPDSTFFDVLLHLLEEIPLLLTTVGIIFLIQITRRQREDHLQIIRDLEIARVQGRRWRNEARAHLNGLGEAMETQFSRWNLTEAEREVALLLLKGLSNKEVAAVRNTSERTAREQARAIYAKAGLTGRAALSAFFLEDLLAPIEGDLRN